MAHEDHQDRQMPRLSHWLTAAAMLLGLSLIIPLFAAFL
jgi:hypothetical protein